MGWGVARLREHKLKLRNALARRARLDVCRDGVETLGHQPQPLLLKSGRAAVLTSACKGYSDRHSGAAAPAR